MSPEEYNDPSLAYIIPGTIRAMPQIAVKHGPNYLTVDLTNQMLLQLLEQVANEIRRQYGPAKSQRNRD